MTRKKSLLKILDDLKLLYTDLNRLIVQYDAIDLWSRLPEASWETTGYPYGIINYNHQVYLCNHDYGLSHLLSIYNPNGETIKENRSLQHPSGIDIDQKNLLIYIAHKAQITILNLNLELISSWDLPVGSKESFTFRGLKLDDTILYLTINGIHQIFLCNPSDGNVLKKWGNVPKSALQGEFNCPNGITVDDMYCYICDCKNHRVQVLFKENGNFYSQWGNGNKNKKFGQFNSPLSIYTDFKDEIIYIGDTFSVQMFLKDGICLQRLGGEVKGDRSTEFHYVFGIYVMNDQLFVSDGNNKRIQVFGITED